MCVVRLCVYVRVFLSVVCVCVCACMLFAFVCVSIVFASVWVYSVYVCAAVFTHAFDSRGGLL